MYKKIVYINIYINQKMIYVKQCCILFKLWERARAALYISISVIDLAVFDRIQLSSQKRSSHDDWFSMVFPFGLLASDFMVNCQLAAGECADDSSVKKDFESKLPTAWRLKASLSLSWWPFRKVLPIWELSCMLASHYNLSAQVWIFPTVESCRIRV